MRLKVYLKYSTIEVSINNTAEAFNLIKKYKDDGFEIESYEIK